MTMPTMINNQRNKSLEAQFNTAHSLISQAITQMGIDNMDISSIYCGSSRIDATEHKFIQDFAKYFQVVDSEYGATGNLTNLGYSQVSFYRSGPGNHEFNRDSHDAGAIKLKNGMIIASSGCWWKAGGVGVDFVVDTNGTKRPNKFGYDVFYFQLGKDNRLYPSSGDYLFATTEKEQLDCCNFEDANTCKIAEDTGCTCTKYAIMNIYPHDNKKKYWDSLP